MIKRVIFLSSVLASVLAAQAVPAYAQVGSMGPSSTFGVIAGLNLAMPKFDPDIQEAFLYSGDAESKGKTGFFAGATFDMHMTPKLGVRLQGTILQTGLETSGSFETQDFTGDETIVLDATQFEVGAMAVIPVGAAARANILAGLFFGFNVSDSIEIETCFDGFDCETYPPEELGFKSTNVSLGVGAEFKATERVAIGALYKLGLTEFEESNPPPFFDSVKMNAFQFFVRFLFGG